VFQFIEKLQRKPEAARKRIAILTAAAITGIIFAVWLSVLMVRVDGAEETASTAEDGASPISILRDNVADFFVGAKSQFSELKSSIENIVQ
jgi:hypothetical protein